MSGDSKISELTAATTPDGTELVPIVQGGQTRRATISQIAQGEANPTFTSVTATNVNTTEAIVGDPGTEGSGINVGGVVYESSFKVSDIDGTNFAQTILHRHSSTLEPLVLGARTPSNTSAHTDVTNGLGLFSIFAAGYAGTSYKLVGWEQFAVDDTGTISETSAPGKWTLALSPDGTVVPAAVITARNDKSVAVAGKLTVASGVATPAGGSQSAGINLGTTANLGVFFGSGVPTLSAAQGSLYLRTDGSSTSTRAYINTDGGTTWTALTTAA